MDLSDFDKRDDGLYVAEFKMDLLLKYGADPEMESTLDGRDPIYYATKLLGFPNSQSLFVANEGGTEISGSDDYLDWTFYVPLLLNSSWNKLCGL
ncbi:hypothetical protein PG987_001555 [Apiospora arundinis]